MNKEQCFDYKTEDFTTDGSSVIARRCFCGTTACMAKPKKIVEIDRTFNNDDLPFISRKCVECGVPNMYQSNNCSIHSK